MPKPNNTSDEEKPVINFSNSEELGLRTVEEIEEEERLKNTAEERFDGELEENLNSVEHNIGSILNKIRSLENKRKEKEHNSIPKWEYGMTEEIEKEYEKLKEEEFGVRHQFEIIDDNNGPIMPEVVSESPTPENMRALPDRARAYRIIEVPGKVLGEPEAKTEPIEIKDNPEPGIDKLEPEMVVEKQKPETPKQEKIIVPDKEAEEAVQDGMLNDINESIEQKISRYSSKYGDSESLIRKTLNEYRAKYEAVGAGPVKFLKDLPEIADFISNVSEIDNLFEKYKKADIFKGVPGMHRKFEILPDSEGRLYSYNPAEKKISFKSNYSFASEQVRDALINSRPQATNDDRLHADLSKGNIKRALVLTRMAQAYESLVDNPLTVPDEKTAAKNIISAFASIILGKDYIGLKHDAGDKKRIKELYAPEKDPESVMENLSEFAYLLTKDPDIYYARPRPKGKIEVPWKSGAMNFGKAMLYLAKRLKKASKSREWAEFFYRDEEEREPLAKENEKPSISLKSYAADGKSAALRYRASAGKHGIKRVSISASETPDGPYREILRKEFGNRPSFVEEEEIVDLEGISRGKEGEAYLCIEVVDGTGAETKREGLASEVRALNGGKAPGEEASEREKLENIIGCMKKYALDNKGEQLVGSRQGSIDDKTRKSYEESIKPKRIKMGGSRLGKVVPAVLMLGSLILGGYHGYKSSSLSAPKSVPGEISSYSSFEQQDSNQEDTLSGVEVLPLGYTNAPSTNQRMSAADNHPAGNEDYSMSTNNLYNGDNNTNNNIYSLSDRPEIKAGGDGSEKSSVNEKEEQIIEESAAIIPSLLTKQEQTNKVPSFAKRNYKD